MAGTFSTVEIEIIPCLSDNYAYLVFADGEAAVVDPSEAGPVLDSLEGRDARLVSIWNTHHHWDHTGGNEELLARFPRLEVCGHASDRGRIPGQTRYLEEEDTVTVGGVRARVLHNPGHTLGAVTYVAGSAAFTGDTLFGAGCGRLFEGDPAMMLASLEKLAALEGDILVHPGHEYTAKNLAFALTIEPGNEAARRRAREVERLRAAGRPSVPSPMALERETNPFLRARVAEIAAAVGKLDPVEVFAELRRRKDRF